MKSCITTLRPFIHVDDVVVCLCLLLSSMLYDVCLAVFENDMLCRQHITTAMQLFAKFFVSKLSMLV